jgi:hypothetical protein
VFPHGLLAGCAKTRAFNLLVESFSQFSQSKNQKRWRRHPRKAIEKPVLRFLGSRAFSHGLQDFCTKIEALI